MEVSVTPELEEYVAAKVASGQYQSPSEVIEEALRLLEEQEQDREERIAVFNDELERRLASLDRGEHVDPKAARERIRRKSDLRKSVPA